jgi:hypothetical protein
MTTDERLIQKRRAGATYRAKHPERIRAYLNRGVFGFVPATLRAAADYFERTLA